MPKLIRLYIQSIAIGFALSVVFLGALVWMDVAGLRHLILGSTSGFVAAAMMVVFNGIIFSGAQFAIAVMRLADEDEPPRGGLRAHLVAIPVRAEARVAVKARRRG
jgi:hypothetical protein